jgi:lipopolysaccharide export system protein LptA
MRFKKGLKLFIVFSLIGVIIYIIIGLKKQTVDEDTTSILTVDGLKMVHVTYNKQHQKMMELKCTEAVKESEDKTAMKDIEGLIFKKGRMNKDIQVFGNHGYVSNNSSNFFVEDNARIASEDFDVRSKNFLLVDQAEMFTDKKVQYETKDLNGVARDGMRYYLKVNVLKFFKTRGHYKKDNREFEFKADTLWVIDEEKRLVMEKNAVIQEAGSVLRSNWIYLLFTDEYKHIKEAASQLDSYFFIEDKEKKETKEIKAVNITSFYDDSGRLSKVMVIKNGEIILKNESNQTMISSDQIELNFNPETGNLSSVSIPVPGQVENTGKTQFRIIADKITANYNDKGEISYCEGIGNCDFIVDDYRGNADALTYDIKKNSLLIRTEGEKDARVITRDNTFNSKFFNVDTKQKILSSTQGVKSVILLNKANVLFSMEPIFINARMFTIYEKENKFKYEKPVSLVQGDISLNTQTLEITDENKIETSSGRTSLTFKADDREVAVVGDSFIFNAEEKNIVISGTAVIKNDVNILKADSFILNFNDKNEMTHILGEGNVNFNKEDITGLSGRVKWLFSEDLLILQDLPQVTKRDGGTTIGKELQIDLKTNKITILSSSTDRTETIIK